MEFSFPVTVPANTAETSPTRETVKLSIGVLRKVGIYFPWGCAGLVGVRICHYEHQLYPTNPGEWFAGNEILIEFESEYLILDGPGEFKIEAYNSDDFYSHTPVVTFNILREGRFFGSEQGWVEA